MPRIRSNLSSLISRLWAEAVQRVISNQNEEERNRQKITQTHAEGATVLSATKIESVQLQAK